MKGKSPLLCLMLAGIIPAAGGEAKSLQDMAAAAAPLPSITIFTAKEVITLDPAKPKAAAVAMVGDRILAVGDVEALKKVAGDQPVKSGEVEGVNEAQHLPQAEVRERSDLFATFALKQPQQCLQAAEAFFGGRAIHSSAHLSEGRILQVQFDARTGHRRLFITIFIKSTARI